MVHDMEFACCGRPETMKALDGLLSTCGIVTLFKELQEVAKNEIQQADKERGPSCGFRSRGSWL